LLLNLGMPSDFAISNGEARPRDVDGSYYNDDYWNLSAAQAGRSFYARTFLLTYVISAP
jgi:hypothetical protein